MNILKYFKKKDVNSVELTRELMKGVTLNFANHSPNIEDTMSENERRGMLSQAESMKSNKYLRKIADHLIDVQGNYSFKEASTIGEMAFGRATVNGISLFMEEIERLSNLYREENKAEEEFDVHDLM